MTTPSITRDYSKFLHMPTAEFKNALYRYESGEKTRYSNYILDIRYIEKQIIPQPETHYDFDIAKKNAKPNAERTAIKKRYLKLKKAREYRFYKKYDKETILC